jgi:multiple sugar transport system permease protein
MSRGGGNVRRQRLLRQPPIDWMVLPLVLVLALVIGYPAIRALTLGFYHYRLNQGDPVFNGLTNYQLLGGDPVFWAAIRNTLVYAGASVAITCLLGLLLALITERISERLPIIQTILLAPWAVPVVVVAFLFRYIFDQESGGANALLLGLHVIAHPLPWLANGPLAMAALVFANVWSQAPFFLLVFLAALRGIPDEIIEAARVDGADEVAVARHIKVPQVMGALVPAVLVAVITNFNNFTLVWSMTEGGPAYDTTTLVIYVYRLAFTQFNVGYASAVGAIWLAVLVVFAVLFVRVTASRAGAA